MLYKTMRSFKACTSNVKKVDTKCVKRWHQNEYLSAQFYPKWIYFVSKLANYIIVGSPPKCCLAYC